MVCSVMLTIPTGTLSIRSDDFPQPLLLKRGADGRFSAFSLQGSVYLIATAGPLPWRLLRRLLQRAKRRKRARRKPFGGRTQTLALCAHPPELPRASAHRVSPYPINRQEINRSLPNAQTPLIRCNSPLLLI